jgi:hypothetical protein
VAAALALLAVLGLASPGIAGEGEVVGVEAVQEAGGTWRFDVTVAHADEGWEHYADKWQVLGPDGTVLGERVLLHPHVEEQPFTRSLAGVAIPDGLEVVEVRTHDSVHGWGPNVPYTLGDR